MDGAATPDVPVAVAVRPAGRDQGGGGRGISGGQGGRYGSQVQPSIAMATL